MTQQHLCYLTFISALTKSLFYFCLCKGIDFLSVVINELKGHCTDEMALRAILRVSSTLALNVPLDRVRVRVKG